MYNFSVGWKTNLSCKIYHLAVRDNMIFLLYFEIWVMLPTGYATVAVIAYGWYLRRSYISDGMMAPAHYKRYTVYYLIWQHIWYI